MVVGAYLLLAGAVALADHHTDGHAPPVCLFRLVTGQPCPTCGTTRLVLAAAHGHWRQAAGHNPLMFALLWCGVGWLVLRIGFARRVVVITSQRSRRALAIVVVLAVLANWVYVLSIA